MYAPLAYPVPPHAPGRFKNAKGVSNTLRKLWPLLRCHRRASMEQLGGILKQLYHLTVLSVKGWSVCLKTFYDLAFLWGGVARILQRARALREPRALTFEAGTASAQKLDG